MIPPRLHNIPADLDVLYGAKAIAEFMGATPKQVYRWNADRRLPTFAIGNQVCARRSTIVAWIERQEAQAQRTPQ